jgi:hypothetical protein
MASHILYTEAIRFQRLVLRELHDVAGLRVVYFGCLSFSWKTFLNLSTLGEITYWQ